MSGPGIEAEADQRVTVHGRSNLLMILPMTLALVVVVSVPISPSGLRAGWTVVWLGLWGIVTWRILRMGITATRVGIDVRNLGRDHHLPWNLIADITAGRSDNISGGVTTIVISRTDGSRLIGRGASAYSAAAVQEWRDQLTALRPSDTPDNSM